MEVKRKNLDIVKAAEDGDGEQLANGDVVVVPGPPG